MKLSALLLALALGLAGASVIAQQQDGAPPSGTRPPRHQAGPGGQAPRAGLHLLPPRAQEQLNLTADQLKQVASLEAEVKTRLEQILTPEQVQQLKQLRPPQHRLGRGPGGRPPGDANPGAPSADSNPPAPAQE
jgi:hypothetical protein